MNQSELKAETFKRCQARENMPRLPSAGKHAMTAERGKNITPLPSAGKTCHGCRAREKHVMAVERGKKHAMAAERGKHVTGAKRGKRF